MKIAVCAPEYWPLPWYLRHFEQVSYANTLPPDPKTLTDVPLIITDASTTSDPLDPFVADTHTFDMKGLREGVILVVYFEQSLWDNFMKFRAEQNVETRK